MLRQALLFTLLSTALAAVLPTTEDIERSTESKEPDISTYAPVRIQCPKANQWVRPANGLSEEESAWVAGRKKKVLNGLSSYLKRLHLSDFDLDGYLQKLSSDTSNVPTIGMAISGGGWSSAFTGTSALLAFDDRFEPSCQQRTGGILQSLTYLSGLSGGSWPVMSLATHNFPTIKDMVSTWHVDESPLMATKNSTYRVTPPTLFTEIVPKFKAGFNVSIADMVGRGFGYEFAAGPNGGMETLLSGVASLSNFQNYEMPFPMFQAFAGAPWDVKYYGLEVASYNNTILEWNPIEFGAWDGPSAFFPTKYMGTTMKDGEPVDDKCVVGFDRASFLMGCAADALNFWQIEVDSNGTVGSFSKRSPAEPASDPNINWSPITFDEKIMSGLESGFKDFLNYTLPEMMIATVPNPFVGSSSSSVNGVEPELLEFIDESEAGQSLPLWSQVQPARNPEFIIAWDADQDAKPYAWTNGTNMYYAYVYAKENGVPFPIIPPAATFVNRGMTTKPSFFGCDANMTTTNDISAPIIAFMPNAPYSAYTNYTWFQSEFSDEQMAVILTNGFNYITAGNGTLDEEWPECLGCAAIDRSLTKLGIERTKQCQSCMTKYCWDGVEDNSDPDVVDMPLMLDPSVSYAEWNKSVTKDFWPELAPKSSK